MIMKVLFDRERAFLELLLEVGRHHPGGVALAEVARRRGLPEPYVRRLAAELARRGILHTRRGRGGGARLGTAPERIRLERVLESPSPPPPGGSPAVTRLEEELAKARRDLLARRTLADLLAWERAAFPLEYVI